jgi:hypothetical protein
MLAETAFNVIQVLSPEELQKLYIKLKVVPQNIKPLKKKAKSTTDYTLEFALNYLKNNDMSEKTKKERLQRRKENMI